MRADVLASVGFALALGVGLLATGCGEVRNSNPPIKIAFVTDCAPPFGPDRQKATAGAELPFLQRGAKLRGPEPSNGVTAVTVAGRRVELLLRCEAYGDFTSLLGELGQLVENEDVDIVVGPNNTPEGLVVKQFAEKHRGITFSTTTGEQSTTLDDPAPNLFGFTLDGVQASAGLGAYAFRNLKWRNALTVGEGDPAGWPEVAGFVAEFCSLGGQIVGRRWPTTLDQFGPVVEHIPRRGVDGVVFPSDLQSAQSFMAAWKTRYPRVGRRLLVNADLSSDAFTGRLTRGMLGLVGVSTWPWTPTPESRAFTTASQRYFGRTGADVSSYDEMEPLLEALARVHGDLSNGERQFQKALGRLHFKAPNGPTSLDARRQAIAPTYLGRVERNAQGKLVVRQIAVIPNVEQTFGGYFRPGARPPSATGPACRRGKPPPWTNSVPATR
jgi:branched-chain amino acid transport system substrate-binding protein